MQCEHIFIPDDDGLEHCHCGIFRTPMPHLDASLYVTRTPRQQERAFNKYSEQAAEAVSLADRKQDRRGVEKALTSAKERLPVVERLLASGYTSKGVNLSKEQLDDLEYMRRRHTRIINRYERSPKEK